MFLRKNYGVLFFLFFWGALFSQERQLQRANTAFEKHAFADAKKLYLKALKKGGQSKELYEKLGDSYYLTGDLETAAQWYWVLLSMYSHKVHPVYRDRYVMSLKASTSTDKIDGLSSMLYTNTTTNKEGIDPAHENFVIKNLKINSKYSDYAPAFHEGGLVFASSRNKNSFSEVLHGWNNDPFLDLYAVKKKHDTHKVQKLKGNINTKFHESSATFSVDKKTIYFTRNNYSKRKPKRSKDQLVLLKIYKADYIDGKWRNIKELPFNSDEYSIAHPALSPDGKYLYFASDMKGSYGQSDLYVVTIDEHGNFGTPRNLGDQINTPGRETFPFVSDTGKLFFASNGHEGKGGLDIFMAMFNTDGTVEVHNLGAPINSPKDDFTFIINEESKMGYFASNRNGGKGNDDIYIFRQINSFKEFPRGKKKTKKKLERVIDVKPNKDGTTSL
ncbi:TolB family protein [Aquimarina aquimarini]|uniref:TolB family protein n=1 Tax=Aquimarina aquimarini TaxID=1191734 RepID=UPI000D55D138|nr:PD40 domain-containing protein [Aquimarina aquimarini]